METKRFANRVYAAPNTKGGWKTILTTSSGRAGVGGECHEQRKFMAASQDKLSER